MSQVTNPAIDPLREGLVMSLEVNLGKRGNILEVGPENASQVLTHFLNFMKTGLRNCNAFKEILPIILLLIVQRFLNWR